MHCYHFSLHVAIAAMCSIPNAAFKHSFWIFYLVMCDILAHFCHFFFFSSCNCCHVPCTILSLKAPLLAILSYLVECNILAHCCPFSFHITIVAMCRVPNSHFKHPFWLFYCIALNVTFLHTLLSCLLFFSCCQVLHSELSCSSCVSLPILPTHAASS